MKYIRSASIHLCIAALAAPMVFADTADLIRHYVGPIAGKGRVVIDASDPETTATKPNNQYARSEIVPVEGQRFTKALRIHVTERVNPPYKVVMHTVENTAAIKNGEQLVVVYAVRCTSTRNEAGTSWAASYLERSTPWFGMSAFEANVGAAWEVRIAKFKATKAFEAGEVKFSIHLGRYEQVIEFGPIILLAFSPETDLSSIAASKNTYPGRDMNAPWRAEAQARIEKVRKGDMRITVVDSAGPVRGAEVRVRMKRHAYEFGTFLESPLLWDEKDGAQKAADGEKYRQTVKELFNRATCPLYWHDGWGYGNPEKRKIYISLADWAQKHGLATRGHVLVYPGAKFMPKTILALSNDAAAMRQAIAASIAERMELGRKYGFKDYDVVNEMRDNPFPMDLIGWDAVPEWFRQCKAIHPEGLMGINENNIIASYGDNLKQREIYRGQIDAILAAGAKVEVIGFQCHFGATPTPPVQVYQRIEEFVKYGVPLHATELDISTDDEELQGDYMRDFLTIFFSHPATTAITQWGFWEGQHWIPRAALFRKDWSIKPNGRAYRDLVFKAWWTDTNVSTGADGTALVRGFLGEYEVAASAGGRTKTAGMTLQRTGTDVNIVLD